MGRRSRDRQRLAQAAARLMVDQGIESYGRALGKAAGRLEIRDPSRFPDRTEIEAAIREHYRLYAPERQASLLARLDLAACSLMEQLTPFSPLLGGMLAAEVAGEGSVVEIYLFAESPDEVSRSLEERAIDHRQGPIVRWRLRRRQLTVPTIHLSWQGAPFVIFLFPHRFKGQLSREERPYLSLKALQRRIHDRQSAGSDGGTDRPAPPCRRSSASP